MANIKVQDLANSIAIEVNSDSFIRELSKSELIQLLHRSLFLILPLYRRIFRLSIYPISCWALRLIPYSRLQAHQIH
jgi:hypothetical protein